MSGVFLLEQFNEGWSSGSTSRPADRRGAAQPCLEHRDIELSSRCELALQVNTLLGSDQRIGARPVFLLAPTGTLLLLEQLRARAPETNKVGA